MGTTFPSNVTLDAPNGSPLASGWVTSRLARGSARREPLGDQALGFAEMHDPAERIFDFEITLLTVKAKDAKGKAKEATGAATGNRSMKAKGRDEQGQAKAKEAGRHTKEAAKDLKNTVKPD